MYVCVVALRFLDMRLARVAQEWRPSSMSTGSIRSLAVDQDEKWLAIGFAAGLISLLDLQTGLLLFCWRAHDSDVVQVLGRTSSSRLELRKQKSREPDQARRAG